MVPEGLDSESFERRLPQWVLQQGWRLKDPWCQGWVIPLESLPAVDAAVQVDFLIESIHVECQGLLSG